MDNQQNNTGGFNFL